MLVYKSSMDCFTKEGRLTRMNKGINKVIHFIFIILFIKFIFKCFGATFYNIWFCAVFTLQIVMYMYNI